jgi:hypothetical protein
MNDLATITEILRHHPWSPEAVARGSRPILSPSQAEERARMLVEDMAAIGCNWPICSFPISEGVILSYYEVPDTDFGKMDEENVDEVQKAHGFGLNWGSSQTWCPKVSETFLRHVFCDSFGHGREAEDGPLEATYLLFTYGDSEDALG